jgi:hypothetical protein
LPQKVFNEISPEPVSDYVGVTPSTGRRVLLLGLFEASVPVAILLSPLLAPAGAVVMQPLTTQLGTCPQNNTVHINYYR